MNHNWLKSAADLMGLAALFGSTPQQTVTNNGSKQIIANDAVPIRTVTPAGKEIAVENGRSPFKYYRTACKNQKQKRKALRAMPHLRKSKHSPICKKRRNRK